MLAKVTCYMVFGENNENVHVHVHGDNDTHM